MVINVFYVWVGRSFVTNVSGSEKLEQWRYVTTDDKKVNRIEAHGELFQFYYGHYLKPNSLDVWLDLNRQPERKKTLRRKEEPGWNEEDLI